MADNTQETPKSVAENSGRNFTFLIAYLVGLSAFGSFMNDMFTPALPDMTDFFHCSVSRAQLGLTFGMIGLALGQFILGPVSDKIGRKPILVASLTIFVIAAIVSVYSPTINFFLGCRLFQGLGASGGYFLARTIPADLFIGRPLAKVMALIGAINGFAPASAPVLGGFVAKTVGWQGIFWILAAIAVILLTLTPRFKESLKKEDRFSGTLGSSFARYGILLKNKRFMTQTLLKGAALGVLFSYVSSAPFIFQRHFGYDELQYGLFMGLNALFIALGSTLALKFKSLRQAGIIGSFILLIFMGLEIPVLFSGKSFWAYELLLLPSITALGMIFTVSNTLAMNEGRSQAGDASAVLGIMGYIFGAVVAPLVGLGNILHSTAIVWAVLAAIVVAFALLAAKVSSENQRSAS